MAGPQTEGTPGTGKATAAERHRKKVEDAFDLVDKLDKENPPGNIGVKADPKPVSRSGLRVRFAIDALISDSDTRAVDDKEIRAGESILVDFGITLPYIWNIPVIGKTVLKVVKYLQKEDRPESVRDILKSLRQK